MTNTIPIKWELNLNTIVAIVGFLVTFVGIISVWNQIQFKQEEFDKWISAHDGVHAVLNDRLNSVDTRINSNKDIIAELSFKQGQVEKAATELDARVTRVNDSYSQRFSDITTQLNAISTQQALTNQALQRIEASRYNSPPDRKSQ